MKVDDFDSDGAKLWLDSTSRKNWHISGDHKKRSGKKNGEENNTLDPKSLELQINPSAGLRAWLMEKYISQTVFLL